MSHKDGFKNKKKKIIKLQVKIIPKAYKIT